MPVEISLALITLAVAIVGTLLRDPSRRVKQFLISLAVLTSIGTIFKAVADDADKEFMQAAITSTLAPPNAAYAKLGDEVYDATQSKGFDKDALCYHNADGMTCFLSSKDGAKHATLVFNRLEISKMYANQLRNKSNGAMVQEMFNRSHKEKTDEELLDKICLLGYGVFYDKFGEFPSDYNYDDRNGVSITFSQNGTRQKVGFTPTELVAFSQTAEPDLFYAIGEQYRSKLPERENP